jgi:hypothetical protein
MVDSEGLEGDGPTAQASLWGAGHYYSPIPDLGEVRRRHVELFESYPPSLPGIDLRSGEQLELITQLATFYGEMPFTDAGDPSLRYKFDNDFFAHGDAIVLYSMLRLHRPNRYVEIGSGWSSALTLDVRDLFFDEPLECVFVEPYPDRLDMLLRPEDHSSTRVLREPLQQVWQDVVAEIAPGDFLFIDSSHVGKIGSDVLTELHEMIPRLPPGVHVHLHDIFYPFEYPSYWVYEGRFWNEAYLLRALLTDNPKLQIDCFNSYLATFHLDEMKALLPVWAQNTGGSIWLQTRETPQGVT